MLLLQIIVYMYIIYILGLNERQNGEYSITDASLVAEFWTQWVEIDAGEYIWTPLKRTLPGGFIEDVMSQWREMVPTLVTATNKLRLANEDLNNRLRSTLKQWLHDHRGDEIEVPAVFDGFFQHESDFTARPDQRVFLDWSDYQGWVRYQHSSHISIRNEISQGDANLDNPYVYWDSVSNNVYLVQNVSDGEWRRAIAVAVRWRQHKINSGFQSVIYPRAAPLPKLKIYQPDSNNHLTLMHDYSTGGAGGDGANAIKLLQYRQGMFAALLPLFVD
jgi:hypothetical protein